MVFSKDDVHAMYTTCLKNFYTNVCYVNIAYKFVILFLYDNEQKFWHMRNKQQCKYKYSMVFIISANNIIDNKCEPLK